MGKMLSRILAPMSEDNFLSDYNYKKALHISGPPEKFADLFSWESLNNELSIRSLRDMPVKISADGLIHKTSDARTIVEHAKRGSSIILEDIDNSDPKLREFLNGFSDELVSSMRFNLYLSFPGKQGYRLHYDTHDFFIFQIEGRKEWHIYPETIESPAFFQKDHSAPKPKVQQLYLKCTLEKGDVLYVPKGHWHDAMSIDEPSIHLTLAMFRPTAIDFFEWFVDELRDDPIFRRSFPFIQKEELSELVKSDFVINSHLRSIVDYVSSLLQRDDLAINYWQYIIAKRKNRLPFSFPDQFATHITSKAFCVVPHSKVLRELSDGRLVLVYSKKTAIFESAARPLLDLLLEGDPFTTGDIYASCNGLLPDAVDKILLTLQQEGLIIGVRAN